MTAITDMQRQEFHEYMDGHEKPSLIDVIKAIEEQAAYLATSHHHPRTAILAELIEGLAQAVRKLAEEKR